MRKNLIGYATALLIVCGIVVGAAVAVGGDIGRALNVIGGAGWLVAGTLLAVGLRRSPGHWRGFAVAAIAALGLSWFVSASEMIAAAIGFGVAGAIVGAVTTERRSAWALLVPALWLPLHVGTAIARAALEGDARVRTDPPPTAVLVPLVMILAAWGCGLLVEWIVARRPAAVDHRLLGARR